MDPAQASPLRKRYTAEHVNSFSKEIHGREFVRLHYAAKVITHLMFVVIAMTATQCSASRINERQREETPCLPSLEGEF